MIRHGAQPHADRPLKNPLTKTQAVASASVVVVARIRPKLPKENTEPDGGRPGRTSFFALRRVRIHVSAQVWRYTLTDKPWASPTGDVPTFARWVSLCCHRFHRKPRESRKKCPHCPSTCNSDRLRREKKQYTLDQVFDSRALRLQASAPVGTIALCGAPGAWTWLRFQEPGINVYMEGFRASGVRVIDEAGNSEATSERPRSKRVEGFLTVFDR